MIRVFNRLVVFLLGAALLGGGLLIVIEGIWTWTNSGFLWIPGHEWLHSFRTTAWSATIVVAVSGVVGGAGFLLALAEMKRQRKRVAAYTIDGPDTWLLLRRSTEAHLARRLAQQGSVSPVKARLNPGRGTWKLTVTTKAATSSRPELEKAARVELDALHAPARRRVKVRTARATAKSP